MNFLEKNMYANLLTRCDDACVITPYLFIYNMSTRSPLYKSFFFRSIHLWNTLPFHTRNCTNQFTFKKKVKEFLWEKVNQYFIFDPP